MTVLNFCPYITKIIFLQFQLTFYSLSSSSHHSQPPRRLLGFHETLFQALQAFKYTPLTQVFPASSHSLFPKPLPPFRCFLRHCPTASDGDHTIGLLVILQLHTPPSLSLKRLSVMLST